jgi:hypothetical protein
MSEGEKAFIEMMRRHEIQASMYAKDIPEYDFADKDVRFIAHYGTRIHEVCERYPNE